MSEGLVPRVARIVSGGFNSLVDAVENAAPETVLEQAIREVEDATDEVRAELGKVLAGRHLANTRLMETNKRHEELVDKIGLAVKEGRDDLAEAAISRQLDIEAQLPVLEQAIAESGEKENELEGYVQALQAKRREMVDELDAFRKAKAESSAPSLSSDGSSATSSNGTDTKVREAENAFDRVIRKTTGLPSGQTGEDAATSAKIAELENLSRDNRIQERLAAFKASKEG